MAKDSKLIRWDVVTYDDYMENNAAGYWCKYHEVKILEEENARLRTALEAHRTPYADFLRESCLNDQ